MPGKASALNPVSEDDRGRRIWDRGEFSKMAEDRLKKFVSTKMNFFPRFNTEVIKILPENFFESIIIFENLSLI